MRILITQSGENIFSEEEKREIIERKFRSTTTNKVYQKKFTLEKINNKKDKDKKNNEEKPVHKNYFIPAGISYKPDDFFAKTTSTFYPKNIRIFTEPNRNSQYNKYRKIRINIQKVNFPKELQSKYDLYKIPKKEDDDVAIEENPPKINKLNNPDYKFSLGEIIDNKNVNKLKNQIATRERVRERLSVVNEKNFRTNYAYVPKMKELNEILNYKKIKGDKLELIKYIHSHTNLSDLFLKNIVTSDKLDIEKFDKISQTLLFNKDVDKKLKLEMERKIKTKQNLNKLQITSNLLQMNKEVKMEEQILDKYRKGFDKKLNYMDKHKEIQKGWRKMGIKYLTAKVFTPRKPISNNSIQSNNDSKA
jgi:hypothetical protein